MDDVDLLLRNAELRNQLERYLDDATYVVDEFRLPTEQENEYLESMLAWERAPILPIADWFQPRLELPRHDRLDDDRLHDVLNATIAQLADKNIVLECTGHLSDRQLYCLIARDILPAEEKRIDQAGGFLHWQCIDPSTDEENWLRFYADETDRREWQEATGLPLPPRERLPFPRTAP